MRRPAMGRRKLDHVRLSVAGSTPISTTARRQPLGRATERDASGSSRCWRPESESLHGAVDAERQRNGQGRGAGIVLAQGHDPEHEEDAGRDEDAFNDPSSDVEKSERRYRGDERDEEQRKRADASWAVGLVPGRCRSCRSLGCPLESAGRGRRRSSRDDRARTRFTAAGRVEPGRLTGACRSGLQPPPGTGPRCPPTPRRRRRPPSSTAAPSA